MSNFKSRSNRNYRPSIFKITTFLDAALLSEIWYGTPLFTENYQMDEYDHFPQDFEPSAASGAKLKLEDYVIRDN